MQQILQIAETDVDTAFKISRVELIVCEKLNHLRQEEQLAIAKAELDMIRDKLADAVEDMNKVESLRKIIKDCSEFHPILVTPQTCPQW